jgi:hypothetical protein
MTVLRWMLLLFMVCAAPASADTQTQSLLNYLAGLKGVGVLSGQHADYWSKDEMNKVAQITAATGKTPTILGVAFAFYNARVADAVTLSNQWLSKGGIVLGTFSPGNPTVTAQILGGRSDGGPYTSYPINFGNLLIPGTLEYTRWYAGLDQLIAELKSVNGPVLLRIFHELDNRTLWWDVPNRTPAQFVSLWQQSITYIRNAGVTNVLWVYNVGCAALPADPTTVIDSNYPGPDYVDVVSLDCYPPTIGNSAAISAVAALGKPVIYAEMAAVKGTTVNGVLVPPTPFTGDTSVPLQTIVNNFPQVVGVVVWGANWALPEQNGMAQFMSNPRLINLAVAPAAPTLSVQ